MLLLQWRRMPEGNGRQQAIIDVRADPAQREALRRIVHGESTAPGSTAFYVYNSTMSEVLDPVYAPIEIDIQLAARRASIRVPGLVETDGAPIVNPHSGQEHRASIRLPNGFEYTEPRSPGQLALEQRHPQTRTARTPRARHAHDPGRRGSLGP